MFFLFSLKQGNFRNGLLYPRILWGNCRLEKVALHYWNQDIQNILWTSRAEEAKGNHGGNLTRQWDKGYLSYEQLCLTSPAAVKTSRNSFNQVNCCVSLMDGGWFACKIPLQNERIPIYHLYPSVPGWIYLAINLSTHLSIYSSIYPSIYIYIYNLFFFSLSLHNVYTYIYIYISVSSTYEYHC